MKAPATFQRMERICLLQISLRSRMTHGYLASSDHVIAVLLIINLFRQDSLREKHTEEVLFSLIRMRHKLHQIKKSIVSVLILENNHKFELEIQTIRKIFREIDRRKDRQTMNDRGRSTDRPADKWIDRQIKKHTDVKIVRYTAHRSIAHRGKLRDRQSDRQIDI